MSMEINSTNSGVTSQIMDLKTSTPGVTRKEEIKTGFKNTNDYSKYLQEKYSYMNTGKTSMQGVPVTVRVSGAFLKKCMDNPEKAAYLEENLAAIPECIKRSVEYTKTMPGNPVMTYCNVSFDENGNMLILATDTTQDSVEDIVLKLDVNSGEVTEVLDLGDLFGEYKKTCVKNSSDELDWMHINTIQYIGNGSVLLSSRETSTIIKVDNIYDGPVVSYMIGEKDFWKDTSYVSLLLNKKGDFTIQGGQHTITYETDESLADGQYYLYMFDNNIGISETRPDYDWSSIGLKVSSAVDGKNSKYYKYLVDENEGTFELVDSFKVPYSGYVSSAQETGDNVLVDSGLKGTFTEYLSLIHI